MMPKTVEKRVNACTSSEKGLVVMCVPEKGSSLSCIPLGKLCQIEIAVSAADILVCGWWKGDVVSSLRVKGDGVRTVSDPWD